MTRLINYGEGATRGLSATQQYMMADLADSINAAVEMDRLTASEALEVLRRLAGMIEGRVK